MIFIVTGFTATLVGIGAQTLIQLEVNENYRARVMTWWSTISFGSLVFGRHHNWVSRRHNWHQ